MMKFLFDSQLAPLMNRVGFVETDIENALHHFLEWLNPVAARSGSLQITKLDNIPLKEVLRHLLPFTYTYKYVLISTQNNWIALTDNLWQSEIGKVKQISKRINARSLQVGAWEHNIANNPKSVNGWGGGFFTLNQGNEMIRHISLMYDAKWDFDTYGDPLPFENQNQYKEKMARNRFTPEMLDFYCKEVGVDFFNEKYYMPEGGTAYIIEMVRPKYENEKSLTLEEMRKNLGWNKYLV